ncbi:MAG: diadenylate cyclase [Chloroflexota bacterium]|nr:diadenylate cyclase [Chloroflexota bacterium]
MRWNDDLFATICAPHRDINPGVLESVLVLAVELAREGREGRRVGSLFTVADDAAVYERSHPLILDPLAGHPDEIKHIDNPDMRETVKELAQLDGAFIVRDDGVVRSACRYLNASHEGINLPLGLGSRHIAGASISRQTKTVAVVVSESAMVRIFDDLSAAARKLPRIGREARFLS